jgi:hypothetical protein
LNRLPGLKTGNHSRLKSLVGVMLDIGNATTVTTLGNRHGLATTPGSTRTSNAMHIVFGFHWQAEINHVRDGRHIQTTRRHIGGN